jgi:hypothetical protein
LAGGLGYTPNCKRFSSAISGVRGRSGSVMYHLNIPVKLQISGRQLHYFRFRAASAVNFAFEGPLTDILFEKKALHPHE